MVLLAIVSALVVLTVIAATGGKALYRRSLSTQWYEQQRRQIDEAKEQAMRTMTAERLLAEERIRQVLWRRP